MLLSIDRVLQLLAEGKNITKIAELAECHDDDVVHIIEEARRVLNRYEKPLAKKKIILKKNASPDADAPVDETAGTGDPDLARTLEGAELNAVPMDSSLTMYIDGASLGDPGPAGIGILIHDPEDRQVGKVCAYIGKSTNNFAEYTALIRALKIAKYFKTRRLRIRTDSDLVVKQLAGEFKVKHPAIQKLNDLAIQLIEEFEQCKIEQVSRSYNDKADYLAKKGAESVRPR